MAEEEKKFIDIVKTWGDVPQAGTEEELEEWMLAHLRTAGKVPVETEDDQEPPPNLGTAGVKSEEFVSTQHTPGAVQHIPRISTFSGDTDSKSDVGFDLWSYEVRCLIKEGVYSQAAILQAVRRSLKGEAGRVVMRCGDGADVDQILDRLDAVYGIVDTGETFLAQFYAARQGKEENVTKWGCRLEDLLDKAIQVGLIAGKDLDEMLRNRFWMGLRTDLKQTSRHKFDTVRSFDRLRVEIRMIEQEFKSAEQQADSDQSKKMKDGAVKMTSTEGTRQKDASEMSELKGLYHKLASNIQTMQDAFQNLQMPHMAMQPQEQQIMQQQLRPQQQVRPGFNFVPSMPQQPGPRQPQQPVFRPQAQGGGPVSGGAAQQGLQTGNFNQRQPQAGNFNQRQPQAGNFNQGQPQAGNFNQGQPQVGNYSQPQGQSQPHSCWNCGQTDHFKRDCPHFICWNCKGTGHARRNCPYPPLN